MKLKIITFLVLLIAFSSCHSNMQKKKESKKTDNEIVLNDSVKKKLIIKGYAISKQVVSVLQKNLKHAIKTGGVDHAIDFCHSRATFLTDSISQALGVRIKRVAKKYRNANNETNEKESDIYKQYVIKWLEKIPQTPQIIPDNDGHPVYYSIIKINNTVCLKCHGSVGEDMTQERLEKIKSYYPDDKAIDFKYAQPRGMWVITFPEYNVVKK